MARNAIRKKAEELMATGERLGKSMMVRGATAACSRGVQLTQRAANAVCCRFCAGAPARYWRPQAVNACCCGRCICAGVCEGPAQ